MERLPENSHAIITPAEAIYNIGAVSRMTGIPIASLHAWERRYGFPRPSARTAGGHRLYSEKDIASLRLVKEQIAQGLSAHQAVAAVQKMGLEGHLPIDQSSGLVPGVQRTPSTPSGRVRLAEALLQHDLPSADRLLAEMLAFTSPEEITLNVIGPLLAELGEAWEQGRITISEEHLVSNYLRQRLLMWMVSGPPARPVSPIVLACAPGEWHEGSLLMLGVLLRRQGWPVAYLGQNVPLTDLAVFIDQLQPQVVVLVAMLAETARLLAEWPKWILQKEEAPAVTFAGRAFVIQPELKELVPGIYLGDSVQAGLQRLESVLH